MYKCRVHHCSVADLSGLMQLFFVFLQQDRERTKTGYPDSYHRPSCCLLHRLSAPCCVTLTPPSPPPHLKPNPNRPEGSRQRGITNGYCKPRLVTLSVVLALVLRSCCNYESLSVYFTCFCICCLLAGLYKDGAPSTLDIFKDCSKNSAP